MTTIMTSSQMETNSSRSWSNNKKYDENDVKKTCQPNLYLIINHNNCKYQSLIWLFWRSYLHNSHFSVYTIHWANMCASRSSHEIIRKYINIFSHNSWNSTQNFVLWYVRTLTKTPKRHEQLMFYKPFFGVGLSCLLEI